ncbi:MAG: hypothetical protein R3F35_11285 [Myxococcota bacterium]
MPAARAASASHAVAAVLLMITSLPGVVAGAEAGAAIEWATETELESTPSRATATPHACAEGETLATGRADASIFAREASQGATAFWCETYDPDGHAHRAGPYWDHHADGSLRTRARYIDGRIEGAVEVYAEDGTLWLRGELVGGEWSGPFELFYANGHRWLSTRFTDGRLDAPVETWFSDGRRQSTTDPRSAPIDPRPMAQLERGANEDAVGARRAAPPEP